LIVAIGVTGCGHDQKRPPVSRPPTSTAPQLGNTAPGPRGRLTLAEYREIVREYRELHPLQDGVDDPAALARGRQACTALRDPNTALIARVRIDCLNAITFFQALRSLEHAGADCGGGSAGAGARCLVDRLTSLAQAISNTAQGGVGLNDELARRGITGLCARSIGITPGQLEAYRQAEQAARDAADAAAAGDSAGVDRATHELSAALGSGSSTDPLQGIIRGCRPQTAARPKPRAKPPRRAPKPLPRVPDDRGINA
jgi:hypothetical protein